MMCDDSTVVASVSLQDGTVSRFPLLVDVSPFGVVRLSRPPPPSDSLPGGSSVLAGSPRPSGSDYGVQVAFPSRWMPLSCSLGLSRRVSLSCFPFSVPLPESQGGLLDCFSLSLNHPGALRSPSSLSLAGGCIESGRLSLWSSGPPPLPAAGVVHVSSPPILVVSPVVFHRGRVCQSPVLGSQSALP